MVIGTGCHCPLLGTLDELLAETEGTKEPGAPVTSVLPRAQEAVGRGSRRTRGGVLDEVVGPWLANCPPGGCPRAEAPQALRRLGAPPLVFLSPASCKRALGLPSCPRRLHGQRPVSEAGCAVAASRPQTQRGCELMPGGGRLCQPRARRPARGPAGSRLPGRHSFPGPGGEQAGRSAMGPSLQNKMLELTAHPDGPILSDVLVSPGQDPREALRSGPLPPPGAQDSTGHAEETRRHTVGRNPLQSAPEGRVPETPLAPGPGSEES